MASLQYNFRAYPPLVGTGLAGTSYMYVVVTDWSIFFVSNDAKYDQSVLLELPFLGIEKMDTEVCESSKYLKGPKDFKVNMMHIYPKVDISKLPKETVDKMDAVLKKVNTGQDIVDAIPASSRLFASHLFPRPAPAPLQKIYNKPYTGRALAGYKEQRHLLHQQQLPWQPQQHNQNTNMHYSQGAGNLPGTASSHSNMHYSQGAGNLPGTASSHSNMHYSQGAGNLPGTASSQHSNMLQPSSRQSGYHGGPLGESVEVGKEMQGESLEHQSSPQNQQQQQQQQQTAWALWQQQLLQQSSPPPPPQALFQSDQNPAAALGQQQQPMNMRFQYQQQQQQQIKAVQQQWMPSRQHLGVQPVAPVSAPPGSTTGSWVEQQSQVWQQQQQQHPTGNVRSQHLLAQRSQMLQQYIKEADQAGHQPQVQVYGTGASVPSSAGPMSWVEEQSLAWQKKNIQAYGEQRQPQLVYGQQYIVQHEPHLQASSTAVQGIAVPGPSVLNSDPMNGMQGSLPQAQLAAPFQNNHSGLTVNNSNLFTYNQNPPSHLMRHQVVSHDSRTSGWMSSHPGCTLGHQAGWRSMAPDQAGWRSMAPDQAGWRSMAPDQAGWRSMAPDQRPPFPPAVSQPIPGEQWHDDDDDDDTPEFTRQDVLEQMLPDYVMHLMGLEPFSALAFYIRRGWMNAHMRLGLVAAGFPGLPYWYFPPASPYLIQSTVKAMRRASQPLTAEVAKNGGRVKVLIPSYQPAQNLALLAFFGHRIVMIPSQQHWQQSSLATGLSGLTQLFPGGNYPSLAPWPSYPDPCIQHKHWSKRHVRAPNIHTPAQSAVLSSDAQAYLLAMNKSIEDEMDLFESQQMRQQENQLLLTPRVSKLPPGGILRGPTSTDSTAAAMAAGADSGGVPVLAATHPDSVWHGWETLEGALCSGCSLFDDRDTELIKEMMAESVLSVPARAMQLASGFFKSSPAAVFIVQRLYAWGTLCALYGAKPAAVESTSSSPYVQWVLSKSQRVRGVTAVEVEADRVDMLAGRKKSPDEEAHDFFGALYQLSTWKEKPVAPRPSDLLRRLCLVPNVSPNLSRTLQTLVDTLNKMQAEKKLALQQQDSVYGLRSTPPSVPAPPTLAPEPLMLSTLQELPYLFALGGPEASEKLLKGTGKTLAGRRGDRHATVRAQGLLQASAIGRTLQSSYLHSYLGFQGGSDAVLERSKGVELWERLMGRLCARLAWKKISLMLSWINSQLAFTQGVDGRSAWLTAKCVQENEDPRLDNWTCEDCTRHLIILCLQLRDPQGRCLAGYFRPQSRSDMIHWARHEAEQYSLDWQASILYELEGLSQEADCLGLSVTEQAYEKLIQGLPMEALSIMAQRLFLRLISLMTGEAAIHGLCGVTVSPVTGLDAAGLPSVLTAEVNAYRVAAVLDSLLRSTPSLAAYLADQHFEQVFHLLRTPDARDLLSSRSCNLVLSKWTMNCLELILSRVRAADKPLRSSRVAAAAASGGNGYGDRPEEAAKGLLSVLQLAGRGSLHSYRMPGLIT
ncbi:hypothetical protein CEUSTIGMA_g7182.t1 [Chlamydomonas eustigma]|uniref:Uncharacterized protein n=1 Tax=Chlamydomonas eustigma TaxID=1157962 RepID=A0A250X9I4_9CHLO|nr:hypothetical protein CEUSTIGMA_g7182.t1 [Chlamydomonas eustigma]|eukprot:GAX79741.1 hypothetical protein CEUSTIGMA_g7182.t1 [Chlamydomonas eustigma]